MKKLFIFGFLSFSIFVFLVSARVYAQETVTESITPTSAETTNPLRKSLKEKQTGVMEKKGQGVLKKLTGKNTRVHLVEAKVTAVGDGAITVEKDGKTYTVNTDTKTKFRRHFWGKSDVAEFSVGNLVNIWGTWADETQTTINAMMIRNLSIMKRHGVFFGTIKTVGDNSFVMTSINRGDQTVTVATTTKYLNRRQQALTFADLQVGHRVRLRGLWDKSQNTITEVVQVKDFSLPTPTGAATTISPTVTETQN